MSSLVRIAALQGAAYFIVSLGYLTLSRLLIVETFVLDAAYIALSSSGVLMVLRDGGGWKGLTALALGGASGGALAIGLALAVGVR